jgi:hypothetical protein
LTGKIINTANFYQLLAGAAICKKTLDASGLQHLLEDHKK